MNSLLNGRSRNHTNPIFNDNKMKLGVFGFNASNGCAITMAPERHIPDWDRDLKMAQAADRMGFEALVPLGRWQTPEDLAAMAVFLASPRAGNVTGQTINVDGGYVMHW